MTLTALMVVAWATCGAVGAWGRSARACACARARHAARDLTSHARRVGSASIRCGWQALPRSPAGRKPCGAYAFPGGGHDARLAEARAVTRSPARAGLNNAPSTRCTLLPTTGIPRGQIVADLQAVLPTARGRHRLGARPTMLDATGRADLPTSRVDTSGVMPIGGGWSRCPGRQKRYLLYRRRKATTAELSVSPFSAARRCAASRSSGSMRMLRLTDSAPLGRRGCRIGIRRIPS